MADSFPYVKLFLEQFPILFTIMISRKYSPIPELNYHDILSEDSNIGDNHIFVLASILIYKKVTCSTACNLSSDFMFHSNFDWTEATLHTPLTND